MSKAINDKLQTSYYFDNLEAADSSPVGSNNNVAFQVDSSF